VTDPDIVLATYPKDYLQCRSDRHRWSRNTEWDSSKFGPKVLERTRPCHDCGSIKVEWIDTATYTYFKKPYIRYAPGYRTAGSGLVQNDFRQLHLENDLNAAMKKGKVHAS
jgi:hypothetical protein